MTPAPPMIQKGDTHEHRLTLSTSADPGVTREAQETLMSLSLDRLTDGCIVALGEFTTEDLRAMADLRERISPNGWMQLMIREYLDVWR